MSSKIHPDAKLVTLVDTPRAEWLAARAAGITATDLPAIMGKSRWRTAIDVWQDKLNVLDDGVDETAQFSEAAVWGLKLETPVAEEWAARAGVKVRRIGMVQNIVRPWMMASLDRRVIGCSQYHEDHNGPCGLEVKTRSLFAGPDWETGVPDDVALQVQWQLAVSGMHHMHVCALIGGQRLVEHIVDRDQELHEQMIAAAEIVHEAVKARTMPDMPPELWTAELLEQRHRDRSGEVELTQPTAEMLIAELRRLTQLQSSTTIERDRIQTLLIGMLEDGDTATIGGRPVFTYKLSSSRRLNRKTFESTYPEIAADQSLWTTTEWRTFRLVTSKNSTPTTTEGTPDEF